MGDAIMGHAHPRSIAALLVATLLLGTAESRAQIAVRGDMVYTMAGPPIQDGVILISDGRVLQIGPAADVTIPDGYRRIEAAVVTPGLIDAHSVVGLAGYLNQADDQDMLDRSAPIQPELRALDAYDPAERLIEWIRGFGITTVHTGHAPGALVAGQTLVVKTTGTLDDSSIVVPTAMVTASLADLARGSENGAPGTRGRMVAMLRAALLEAQRYQIEQETSGNARPARALQLEILGRVLAREMPLLITAHRAHDIMTALRLAKEFEFDMILDGAAEAPLILDELAEAQIPIIVHPTMYRATGETEHLSFETAATLHDARIPIALQSGFEPYVPRTRVVLFEAGMAAAHGLPFDAALATITIGAATILGIDDRVGSLEIGKAGDIALFDGDPFEYTTHCIGVIIDGIVMSEDAR